MAHLLRIAILLLFMYSFGPRVYAQLTLPQASSAQVITQDLGISTIKISYHRPNAHGRVIFGDLVPYGEVWRTGANTVTNIHFDKEVSMAGHVVPAGEYGLLTIPKENSWTIILSKNNTQWGAYTYQEKEDLIRFEVEVERVEQAVETFSIYFSEVYPQSANLNIAWAHTRVRFPITVDQDAEITASILSSIDSADKKPYFSAAQYYYNTDKDLKQALTWINLAEQGDPEAVHIKYWKALIQLKSGDRQGAIATATQGVALAKASQNPEYVKLNASVLEQAKSSQ